VLASAEAALALSPDNSTGHNLRGLGLKMLARREEAIASFDRAIACDPGNAAALNNRGELLHEVGKLARAIADLEAALRLDPTLDFAAGQLLHLRMRLADWRDWALQVERLTHGLSEGTLHVSPFAVLALIDEPQLHRAAAATYLTRLCPNPAPSPAPYPRAARIRIGYFSADFFDHATMHLIADMLEAHDRDRFEVIAYSYGPDGVDHWRRRAERAVERFVDVRELADELVAALARSHRIDIAVDLKGITAGSRHSIFAARAAPLQLGFLGYPGSMPCNFIDYLLADRTVVPPEERAAYGEKIIWLPGSYQPNCRLDGLSAPIPTRRDLGLPEARFLFCCFNQTHKITPERFDAWMAILREAEGSVLWLWADDETARANLRREAEARGVAGDRLHFAATAIRAEHLARLSLADLFLDTAPYGAHTSASDALRAGVPVLTCPGRSFASRVAASLLLAHDLPELICTDIDDYVCQAVALARSGSGGLKARLAETRATASLFDRFSSPGGSNGPMPRSTSVPSWARSLRTSRSTPNRTRCPGDVSHLPNALQGATAGGSGGAWRWTSCARAM
jgi:predicted O-linked N-acetylglucosamine transferase (SPINDLY family)